MVAVKIKENKETTTYIQIHSICKSPDMEVECEEFWGKLSDTLNSIIKKEENIIILGDFIARLGTSRTQGIDHILKIQRVPNIHLVQ